MWSSLPQLDMGCRLFTMTGLPGQTDADVAATVAFLRQTRPTGISVKPFHRYPGLPMPAADAVEERERGVRQARLMESELAGMRPAAAPGLMLQGAPLARAEDAVKAFVTGGTGFVGAAVVRELLAEGIAVAALARPSADQRNLAGLDVTIAAGDVRDHESLLAGMAGCAWVFHVAAYYSTQ